MCWSAEVSLNTYIFSLFGFLFGLYSQKVDWRVLLIGIVFSSMQLVEYNLWTDLNNPKQNTLWSQIGKYVVWAEFFAAANVIPDPSYRNLFFGLSTVYIGIQSFLTRNKKDILTTVSKNGHLMHNWYTDNNLFNSLMPLLLITPFWIRGEWIWALFITATASITLYYSRKTGEFSSLWCYLSTLFWFLVIFKSIGLDTTCKALFKNKRSE